MKAVLSFLLAGCGVAVAAAPAAAAEFYVSPEGTAAGDGSAGAPWDLATAFEHPAAVMPGDTIWLVDGTYAVTGNMTTRLTGTAEAPIVLRQAPGARATLDTGASADNRIFIEGGHTWYWGFEVMSSAEDRWSDGEPVERGFSLDIAGQPPGIKLINLIVHDTQSAVGFWVGATEGEMHGCLIYYNGYDAADRGHGHGIYTQNEAGQKVLSDNIVFGQYSHGIHAYTEGGSIDNYLVEGTIAFDNGVVSTVSGRTRNILIGGAQVAESPILRRNYTWFDPADGDGTSSDLGYGAVTNAVVEDNLFVGGGNAFRLDSTNPTVEGNTFWGALEGVDPATFPDNEYYDATPPTGTRAFVRANAYDPDRAHVAVFNFDGADTVSVDVSRVLGAGDSYELRDAQSYFGAPVLAGVHPGGDLVVPMTSTEVAPVIGQPATPFVHTSKQFGAFVLIRTAVGQGSGAGGGGGAGGEASGGSGPAGAGGNGSGGGSAGGSADDGVDDGGCSCAVPGQPGSTARWGLAALAAAMTALRARRRRARP